MIEKDTIKKEHILVRNLN